MTGIPFALPWLDDEEIQALAETVRSGWIMEGPRVAAFEAAMAAYTAAPHARAVSSCTTGLHLALKAVGVRPGDAVITASCSFIATANSIRNCHAEPVFADIDPDTLNLSPDALARCLAEDFGERDGGLHYRDTGKLTAAAESPLRHCKEPVGRLGAILVVHQVGTPADLSRILPIADKYGVPVVEDAACALGSEVSLDGGES